MEIPCKFEDSYYKNGASYACQIRSQFIPKNAVINPKGRHTIDEYSSCLLRNNTDVTAVIFSECRLSKIPQGLTKIFPNLKILSVWYSTLKNVHKNDLIEYKQLERIGLCNNQIEFVRGDLFEGFENLNEVSIDGDAIKLIEPNILDGLDKLDYVQLGGNQYPIQDFSLNKDSLDETKDDLILQYYKNHKDVKNFRRIDNENKQFKMEVQKLIEENKTLKTQNNKKNFEVSKLKKQNLENNPKDIRCEIKQFLQNDQSFQDLKISIEDHEFPVHKVLVAARSPTLAELLQNNPEVENLNLVDISVETFEVILKFFYNDELPEADETNFLHLFASAGKLKIEELKDHAATKLIGVINRENALDILKMSNKYEHDQLRSVVFDVLKKEFPQITFEDEWAKDMEIVTKIIEGFQIKEELIKKAEEEFQNLILKTKNL